MVSVDIGNHPLAALLSARLAPAVTRRVKAVNTTTIDIRARIRRATPLDPQRRVPFPPVAPAQRISDCCRCAFPFPCRSKVVGGVGSDDLVGRFAPHELTNAAGHDHHGSARHGYRTTTFILEGDRGHS